MSEPAVGEAAQTVGIRPPTPRSAVAAAVGITAGVIVVLLSSSPTWVRVTLKGTGGPLKLTGSGAGPAAVPLALVAAAGLIALALVRGWVRRLLAAFIFAAGAGVLTVALRVLGDPVGAARRSSKVTSAGQLAAAHLAPAPYVCALGAAMIVIGALLAVVFAGRWPGPTRRYERAAKANAGRPADDWEALERGEDPTSG